MTTVRNGSKKGDLEPEDEGAKSFAHTITHTEAGDFHADLTKEQQQLLKQLRDHAHLRGKAKGEITISLKYAVDDMDVVSIETNFKVKTPQPPRKKSTMWISPGGNLVHADPRQESLPGLRPVPSPASKDAPDAPTATRGV
jgi:hypothetical protein